MLNSGRAISTKLWNLVTGQILWEATRTSKVTGSYPHWVLNTTKSVFSEDDKYMAVVAKGNRAGFGGMNLVDDVRVLNVSDLTEVRKLEADPQDVGRLTAIAVSPLRDVAVISPHSNASVTPAFWNGKDICLQTIAFRYAALTFCGNRRLLAFGIDTKTTEVIGYSWETQSLTRIQSFNLGMKGSTIDGIPSILRIDYQSRISLRVTHPPSASDRCTTFILTAEGRTLGKHQGPTLAQAVIRDDTMSPDRILFLDDERYIRKWNTFTKVPQHVGRLENNEISLEEVKALAHQLGQISLIMEDERISVFTQGKED